MDSLFVVSAHVPDAVNAALLRDTINSIVQHRDLGDQVLVVDNASPMANVVASIVTNSSLPVSAILLRVLTVSRGMLGALCEADHVLRSARGSTIGRIIVLQHSTRLLCPIPPSPATCLGVALSGTANTSTSASWLSRSSLSMRWASARAHELRVPCGPRCAAIRAATDAAVCTRWDECGDDWAAVLHATLAFSRAGWSKLASYGLWPGQIHGKLVHSSSFSRSFWQHQYGTTGSAHGIPHAGIEILAGILLAHINGWQKPASRCACSECLEKRHGRTVVMLRVHPGAQQT